MPEKFVDNGSNVFVIQLSIEDKEGNIQRISKLLVIM